MHRKVDYPRSPTDYWILDSLTDKREEKPYNQLPLVFIGHSFGGNLIEQVRGSHTVWCCPG